jgi:site-specific recombinase
VEAALWAGVAALEERAQLMRRVANRAGGGQFSRLTDRFNDEAEHADHQARLLRDAVTEYASTDLSTLSGAGDQGD